MKLSELEALETNLLTGKLITEQKETLYKWKNKYNLKNEELENEVKELKLKDEKLAVIENVYSKNSCSCFSKWKRCVRMANIRWLCFQRIGWTLGKMHNGIDIARTDRSTSPPIYAAESGTVTRHFIMAVMVI